VRLTPRRRPLEAKNSRRPGQGRRGARAPTAAVTPRLAAPRGATEMFAARGRLQGRRPSARENVTDGRGKYVAGSRLTASGETREGSPRRNELFTPRAQGNIASTPKPERESHRRPFGGKEGPPTPPSAPSPIAPPPSGAPKVPGPPVDRWGASLAGRKADRKNGRTWELEHCRGKRRRGGHVGEGGGKRFADDFLSRARPRSLRATRRGACA